VEKPKKNLPFVAILISIVSIISISQIFSTDFRIKILNIFRMPFRMISGTYYTLRDVSNFSQLREENKILRETIANLKKEMLKLKEASLENERLKKLLEFRRSKKYKFIPAMVIARSPLGLRDTIIIDKGKKHGVRKDLVVISGAGLVGRTRETGWSISRVLLITDTDSVVSGIVVRTRDEGAVAGGRQSDLIMKYLELDCDVKQGDEVITSGFGSVSKKGILISEVVSIEKDDTGLYMNAIVKPQVDMMKLEEVLVMR